MDGFKLVCSEGIHFINVLVPVAGLMASDVGRLQGTRCEVAHAVWFSA